MKNNEFDKIGYKIRIRFDKDGIAEILKFEITVRQEEGPMYIDFVNKKNVLDILFFLNYNQRFISLTI